MNLSKTLPALIISVLPGFVFSQEGGTGAKNNVIPPSPTAAALGKYGDIPVSLYTGTASVEIPIYEVKERGGSIPISLSYHTGGLKVEEVASWVGQGWSLSAGGVITRSVRGLPDELTNGFGGFDHRGREVIRFINNQMSPSDRIEYQDLAATGVYDTEPDIFYFNFPGKSGKIIFDAEGIPVIIPTQKLKVTGDPILGFTINTEDGTTYVFDAIEVSTREDACDLITPEPFNSSWYLSSITFPDKTGILFEYLGGTTYQNIIPSESKYSLYTSGGGGCPVISSIPCQIKVKITTRRLWTITTTSGLTRVVFNADTPRTDLPAGSAENRLDNIEINGPSRIVKKIELSYFQGGYGAIKRMLLQKVQETSPSGGEPQPPYAIEYYQPDGMPPLNDKSQDHWGFFNGSGNETLVPASTFINQAGTVFQLDGGNRAAYAGGAMSGSIYKIIYPTGGSTEFVFESNDYGYVQNAEFNSSHYIPRPNVLLVATTAEPHPTTTMEIATPQLVGVRYAVNYSPLGLYPDDGEPDGVLVKNAAGSTIYVRGFGTGIDYFQIDTPGTYTVEAFSENPNTTTSIDIFFSTGVLVGGAKKGICGGQRIRKTIDHDGVDEANNVVTSYDYRAQYDTTRSSGVLNSLPNYSYDYTLGHIIDGQNSNSSEEISCQYFVRTANANILGSTQGSHVGYRQVTVSKTNSGKAISTFRSAFEFPDDVVLGYPFAIATSYDHLRGSLMENLSYSVTTGATSLIATNTNTYTTSIQNRKMITALKVGYVYKRPMFPTLSEFSAQQYQHIGEWTYLSQSMESIYPPSPTDPPYQKAQRFIYDNPAHMQLTSVISSTSTGDSAAVQNFYPLDYTNTTNDFIQKMKGLMDNTIIESVHKLKKGSNWFVNGGSFTRFDEIVSGAISAIVPVETFQLETTGLIAESSFHKSIADNTPDIRYKTAQTFKYHPQKFYLVEVTARNNISTSYLWSYKASLPIAELRNATYSALQTALTASSLNEVTIQSSVYPDATIRTMLAAVKSNLPNAIVTTFTHDPLVGITSRTDPNGKSTFYIYDGLRRLDETKDHDGNILNKNIYHYKK